MAGRNFSTDDDRPQRRKRGNERGRRQNTARGGAPRSIASGKQREEKGTRARDLSRLHDEDLLDLPTAEKLHGGRERLQKDEGHTDYGAALEGQLTAATVVEVQRGSFLIRLDTDASGQPLAALPENAKPIPRIIRSNLRGTLEQFDLGLSSLVAAGDRVEVVIPPVSGNEEYSGMLARVHTRKNAFRRIHPSGNAIQTIGANVDQVAIVASAQDPEFRPGFVDRVLACAVASGIPALLVLNKCDLGVEADDRVLLEVYRSLGPLVFETSARNGTGLDELAGALAGKRTVFCGHSGVGKSSLLIQLAPEFAEEIRVGEISNQTNKGTHTTTHPRLYLVTQGKLAGAEIIDAPGVREFTPADTDRQNLWACFSEIAALQGQCRFPDCTHRVEAGCAILAALKAGEVHPRRHESYVRIYDTLPA